MRLPSLPRALALLAIPVLAFAITAGLTLGKSDSKDEAKSPPAPAPTLAVAVSNRQAIATTVPAQPTVAPQPTAVTPPDRTDCGAIRAAPEYRSPAERDFFQKSCITIAPTVVRTTVPSTASTSTTTTTVSTITQSTGEGDGGAGISGTADRLVIRRLGMNAPVNVRKVGGDGVMGDPAGPTDVIWYDFSTWPGYGGYAGYGGNTVIAGHVDYHNYGLAVFAPLRNIQEDDIIEYQRSDGTTVTYQVQWYADITPDYNFNSLIAAGPEETITLVTCNGTFNFDTHEYDHRRVVRGVRIS